MNFTSKLIQESVEAFSSLPGIGKKSALRLVLYLMNQPKETTQEFTYAIQNMRENIKTCTNCHNISDTEICGICSDQRRDASVICVVESIRDVMAIEDTGQFRGKYHVLGGVISPIEGVGPSDLNIASLADRIQKEEVQEVIMAVSPTIEGDTTNFYIYRQVQDMNVQMSTIARGISAGSDLEYTDEITLGRSIIDRIPFENSLKS